MTSRGRPISAALFAVLGSRPYSSARGVGAESEQVVEAALGGVHFGEHAPGTGLALLALVEQQGSGCRPGDRGACGRSCASWRVRPYDHEPGDDEGEHVVEDVDADLGLGEVEHRGEGDDGRFLHPAEVARDRLLGAVVGDDRGGRRLLPVLSVNRTACRRAVLELARAWSSAWKPRRSSAGVFPVTVVGTTRSTQRGATIAAISASTFSLAFRVPPRARWACTSASWPCALASVWSKPGTACRAGRRSGDDQVALLAEDDLPRLERGETGEALLVDDLVAARNGEQIGVVRRRKRPDEGELRAIEQLVVVPGVLPGVEDQGEALLSGGPCTCEGHEAGDELFGHRWELGDVGLVPGRRGR